MKACETAYSTWKKPVRTYLKIHGEHMVKCKLVKLARTKMEKSEQMVKCKTIEKPIRTEKKTCETSEEPLTTQGKSVEPTSRQHP